MSTQSSQCSMMRPRCPTNMGSSVSHVYRATLESLWGGRIYSCLMVYPECVEALWCTYVNEGAVGCVMAETKGGSHLEQRQVGGNDGWDGWWYDEN
jgi:hypothetical protein